MNEKDLQIKGLLQGMNIPLEKVRDEICPECPFKTAICDFMIKIHTEELKGEGGFVCKGMRHWATKSN